MTGKLIIFEGIDGCGKTTQAKILLENLKTRHIPVILLREPGGTEVGERIRAILLDKSQDVLEIDPYAELMLFLSARRQLFVQEIKPRLNRGETVILDRFGDSSVAYQGYGHGVDISLIQNLNKIVTEQLSPSIIFLFDLDCNIALSRIKDIGDRIERNDKLFFQRVRQGYLDIAKNNPHIYKVLDATKTIQQLTQEIEQIIF